MPFAQHFELHLRNLAAVTPELKLPAAWLSIGASLIIYTVNLIAAATAATVSPASRPEMELMARQPLFAAGAAALFLFGLVADAFLLLRVAEARSLPAARRKPVLKVGAKPWDIPELAQVALTLLAVFLGSSLVFWLVVRLMKLNEAAATPWLVLMELLLRIAALAGIVVYLRRRRAECSQAFGLRAELPPSAMLTGALFYVASIPPVILVSLVWGRICRAVGIEPAPQQVAELLVSSRSVIGLGLLVALTVAVAPLFEEVFFRGFAYPALKQRLGVWRALLIVSAVFALIHLHVPSFAPLLALAVGFALAYEWTGSLVAPVTMHVLFNAGNVAMLLYLRAHP
jgi:hypothetical protein